MTTSVIEPKKLTEQQHLDFAKQGYNSHIKENKPLKLSPKMQNSNGNSYGYAVEKVNESKTGQQAYIIVSNNPTDKNYDRKKSKM